MDFWNNIEEIKEQYFMKIRSAVLDILQESMRTLEISNIKHEFLKMYVLKIVQNKSVLLRLSAGEQKHCQQGAASDAHRLNAQYVYCVYTNYICNLIILTAIPYKLPPALRATSTALSRLILSQLSNIGTHTHILP